MWGVLCSSSGCWRRERTKPRTRCRRAKAHGSKASPTREQQLRSAGCEQLQKWLWSCNSTHRRHTGVLCAEPQGDQKRRRLRTQGLSQAPLSPLGLPSMTAHESPRAGTGCAQSPRPLVPRPPPNTWARLPAGRALPLRRLHPLSSWKVLPPPGSAISTPFPAGRSSPLRHLHPLCSVLPPLGRVTMAPHRSSRMPRWVLFAGEQGADAPLPPESRRACSGSGFNRRRDIQRAGLAQHLPC